MIKRKTKEEKNGRNGYRKCQLEYFQLPLSQVNDNGVVHIQTAEFKQILQSLWSENLNHTFIAKKPNIIRRVSKEDKESLPGAYMVLCLHWL